MQSYQHHEFCAQTSTDAGECCCRSKYEGREKEWMPEIRQRAGAGDMKAVQILQLEAVALIIEQNQQQVMDSLKVYYGPLCQEQCWNCGVKIQSEWFKCHFCRVQLRSRFPSAH